MTIQISEKLLAEGAIYTIDTTPLDGWINAVGFPFPLSEIGSICWRRYHATWELRASRIYLVAVEAHSDEDGHAATLEDLFPGFGVAVFAHWFSGPVTCSPKDFPDSLKHHRPPGWTRTATRGLKLRIRAGVVTHCTEFDQTDEEEPQ